jgi:hypothetical protein
MTDAELLALTETAQQRNDEYATALKSFHESLKSGSTPTQAERDALRDKWDALVVAGDALG